MCAAYSSYFSTLKNLERGSFGAPRVSSVKTVSTSRFCRN